MAHDELARLEWEIVLEQARFCGPAPEGGDEPLEPNDQGELSLGELLLGGALVGLVLLALAVVVAVIVGAFRVAFRRRSQRR